MTRSLLLTDSSDPDVAAAVALLPAYDLEVCPPSQLASLIPARPALRVVIVTTHDPALLRAAVEAAHRRSVPVVMACGDETARRRALELRVEEWYRPPVTPDELAARTQSALARRLHSDAQLARNVERVAFAEMLYDARSGMPTVPVVIDRTRAAFSERGELVVFYLDFVRYAKIEEIYGWEKLDAVLETTAAAVREYLERRRLASTEMMVGYINDDDFIFFHVPATGARALTDHEITDTARQMQQHIALRLEHLHGQDIAALFDIYVGYAHVFYSPKIRLERLIYRGIREAANAARSIEERERARKMTVLKQVLHDRSVYIEFHPIVRAESEEIFGYEGLARGHPRSLRSPEVMFEVAAQADLVWELSRLCRVRAIEGAQRLLAGDQLLFLNVDPHDFDDPNFGRIDAIDPHRIVIEITERTAIKNYPKFRERLQGFRKRGFRFAVDDAGSGYAGLGSIANLEPDFIKLDISLITSIDTNFIKQNLVETMVGFAREHGAMVIAEGVERAEEMETVKRLGVPLVQGFFLHPPERFVTPSAHPALPLRG